jgi:ADP-ribose pyrophosphatase YjhB (NUDIX family)
MAGRSAPRGRGGKSAGGSGRGRKPKDSAASASTSAAPTSRLSRPARSKSVLETSAGGLVLDIDGSSWRAALIAKHDRRGRLVWSLPKGHIEGVETPEEAAIREVQEETGLISEVVAPLGVIDFWFMSEGQRIHKTVHHFLLRARGGELSDADVEVAEVAWVNLDDLPQRLSHADERKLLDVLPPLLADLPADGTSSLR